MLRRNKLVATHQKKNKIKRNQPPPPSIIILHCYVFIIIININLKLFILPLFCCRKKGVDKWEPGQVGSTQLFFATTSPTRFSRVTQKKHLQMRDVPSLLHILAYWRSRSVCPVTPSALLRIARFFVLVLKWKLYSKDFLHLLNFLLIFFDAILSIKTNYSDEISAFTIKVCRM